ncbi:MAG: ABC transporter ATP-binding protein [Coriobacteriia bacterium]|nr:ABC transporter ATP-binding protein [Coriobacteriia bacterium]
MRIVRYLLEHKAALALVFLLLFVQVFCDLSLPNYTSEIVDVGIQQGGVSDVAPDRMTAATYEDVAGQLKGADRARFEASYQKVEQLGQMAQDAPDEDMPLSSSVALYQLTDAGIQDRSELNRIMALPLMVVDVARAKGYGTLDSAKAAAIAKEARKAASSVDESLLQQQAIQASRAEYARAGVDLSALQFSYLLKTGGAMLLVAALSLVVSVLIGLLASRTGAKIGRKLREQLFGRVVSFSEKEINAFGAASLITRGTNDIQLIQMVCIILQHMVLYAPIMAVGGIIMVVRHTSSLWWVIALAVVAVLVTIAVLMGVTMPKFRIMQKLIDKVNLVAREQLSGLSVVRAFDRESFEEDRFRQANEQLMGTQLFTNRAMSFMMPAMMLIMNATSVLIVWFGAQYVDMGTMQTGDLIALITYSMMIVMSFLMIGMVAIMLPRANVAAERVDEVIATTSSVGDPKYDRSASTTLNGARIAFDHVFFSYGDEEACVLEDVSFVVEPGQTCAIIGSTGSGKSTILKLIERFSDVTSGRVTIDGADVRDIPQHELRGQLAYVPQKAFLFSGTIEDNVNYAHEADSSRIDLALGISQAQGFVSAKEEGLASEVSQGGTNVSGGQRQRLAIARALARDARAYLFDDSFSALDYQTDARLRQGLSQHLGGRTVIIVAQRIATIMGADNIIVLDEGRVVGQGTHAQLLGRCDVYREIAESQLSAADLARTESCSAQVPAGALEGGEQHV